MAAAPLALDKHRGLRLRDANRPITAPQKRVELEVTPDKAPTLRGVAPAVGFYAWATPHKKQQPRTRAISHPALREPISKATPLSQAVRNATARRDASIGDAYRAKHAALRRQNRLFDLRFDDAKLGFKICLGRRSVDARRRSTRRRVLVDETFPSCQAFDKLRPHDELVAICVEVKILRRVRPPRHRRDACSMAWRCRFLAARPSQDGRIIAEK